MSWDEMADTWDTDPIVKLYSEQAFASLRARISLEGLRVLDFGCGTGLLTAAMAEHAESVVGLDLSSAMIDVLEAKSLPNVTAVAGSLEDQPLGTFDLVTCSSVCAFVPDYPETVRQLTQRLNPGGWFVQWDWELDPDAEEPFGLTRAQICAALAHLDDVHVDTGFRVQIEDHTMAPLMGLGRTRTHRRRRT